MPRTIGIGCFALAAICATLAGAGIQDGAITFRTVALSGDPAPGTESGVTFVDFGGFPSKPPAINYSGETTFVATTTDGQFNTSREGIWSEGSGTLALAAFEDEHAAGTPADVTFSDFGRPAINAEGHIVFEAAVAGASVDANVNKKGTWTHDLTSQNLVVREGDPAPGMATGVNFNLLYPLSLEADPVLNDATETAFYATLVGADGTSLGDVGLWSNVGGSPALIAQEGDQAPGTPAGVTFTILRRLDARPELNSSGQTAFFADLFDPDDLFDPQSGIWAGGPGSLVPVAYRGDPAPGLPAGTEFTGLGAPVMNDAGQIAFTAFFGLADAGANTGIWSTGSGALALVARGGMAAPGMAAGVIFDDIVDSDVHVINGAGHTAFPALLSGSGIDGSNNRSLWSEGSGSLKLVAREGTQAPGTESGVVFAEGTAFQPSINGAGQVAFFGILSGPSVDSGNQLGVWAEDSAGVLTLVVREGQLMEVAPGDFRTVAFLDMIAGSGGEDGKATSFNDLGQLAFLAEFTDGSAGIFVAGATSDAGGAPPEDTTVDEDTDGTPPEDMTVDDDADGVVDEIDNSPTETISDGDGSDVPSSDGDCVGHACDSSEIILNPCGTGVAMIFPFILAVFGLAKLHRRR